MSSFRSSLKGKCKNPADIGTRRSNFKIEINYVNSNRNSIESIKNRNTIKKSSVDGNCIENELSYLSNLKFDKNRSFSKLNSSIMNKVNVKPVKNTFICSSMSNTNIQKFITSIENQNKFKKNKFLTLRNDNIIKKMTSKTPKAKKSLKMKRRETNTFNNYAQNFGAHKIKISEKNSALMGSMQSYDYYNNNEKLLKINEKINNELGVLQLKKKVKNMRKSIIKFTSSEKNMIKNIIDEETNSRFRKSDFIKSDLKKNNIRNSNITSNIQKNYKSENSNKNENSQEGLKETSAICTDEKMNKQKYDEKYRKIEQVKVLFDSFDDEEYDEEMEIDYYLSPNSYFVLIFDWILFFSAMFYLIYVPYMLSKNSFVKGEGKVPSIILIIIDIFYILDLIINFFRAYQTFDEQLERRTKFIILHYLQTWFLFDLIQAIPFYSILSYIGKKCIYYNLCSSEGYNNNRINPIFYLIILLKIIKVYKMLRENNAISSFSETLSENEFIDNNGYILYTIFYSLSFLNLCSFIFIFLGRNSYPGWIMRIDMYDESYINIYVASLYYILVTITTVGYGDITGNSYPEITYQMFLLIIGTLAYSFIISYISNYIVKKNHKSIAFEKNVSILKDIRLQNPNMKDRLYKEVLKNLFNEQLYEKNDKSILFDCLPYAIKNKLILEIYKPFINNLVFFKGVENSDFIVKVVTSLKPLLSFKNNILIQEGDFIKEIFFVKKGVLLLNITIDKENMEESLKKYIDVNELGNIKIAYMPAVMRRSTTILDNNVDNMYIGQKEMKKNNNDKKNTMQDIKIIEIRKNEHFGDALMFLNERSPLVVKVKSKTAELLVLRKMEAIETYCVYPNIWNRINKKSLYNMEQIKQKIKKTIFELVKKHCPQEEKNLDSSRSEKGLIALKTMQSDNEDRLSIISLGEKKRMSKNSVKIKNKKTHQQRESIQSYNNLSMEIIEEKSENKDEEKTKNKETKISNNEREILFQSNREKTNSTFNYKNKNDLIKEVRQLLVESHGAKSGRETIDPSKIIKQSILNKTFINLKTNNYNSRPPSLKSFSYKRRKKQSDKENEFGKTKNNKKKVVKYLSMDNFNKYNDKESNKSTYSTFINKLSLKNQSKKYFQRSFINLSKSNEKSFELISSYENINKITNKIYIKNTSLQSKTKSFLINECCTINNDSLNNNNSNKNSMNKKKSHIKNKIKSDVNDSKSDEEGDKKSVNSVDYQKLKSKKKNVFSILNINSIKRNKKSKKIVSNLNLENLNYNSNIKNHISKQSIKKLKSDLVKVNEKLDMISKNIKGANKNINNPDEFYMDFFNNIIKQETSTIVKKEDKKEENKKEDSKKEENKKIINCNDMEEKVMKKEKMNSFIMRKNFLK